MITSVVVMVIVYLVMGGIFVKIGHRRIGGDGDFRDLVVMVVVLVIGWKG